MKTQTKVRVGFFAGFAVLLALYLFFSVPNLNPLYRDGAFFWLFVFSVCLVIATVTGISFQQETDFAGRPRITLDKSNLPPKWVLVTLACLWGLYILVQLVFTPLFFWGRYRDQMPNVEPTEFTSEMRAIDINQIPVVDKDLARTLADKKLGEKPSLGSQVVLGDPTMQNVNGELTWVVPLHHSGFFKWLANMEGAAGYIKVSATNMQDVKYIEDYKIKIQPQSYFMHDLERTARFKGSFFTGITDYSFELDDDGKPYWVVSTYKNICGFSLPEADGILLIDAETGSTEQYSLENVPEWIDRVQPEDFVLNQINNRGEYVHGIFNFSNKEKFRTSSGTNIVYNDGRCYLFTGITSVGSDESAIGFYLVDMVTKEPILYRMSGATEASAQQSAQGKVQDLRYTATAPIILNVFDQPTYFMTLKDSARLVKQYAFVSVKDYMIVGTGSTMKEAQADYAKSLKDISDKPIFGEEETENSIIAVGTIERINFTIDDSETVYVFTLSDMPGKIFTVSLSVSEKLPITKEGDSIQITYLENEAGIIVTEFENKSF